MKKWILKAIVQKTISYLPYRHHINQFFQKNITKGLDLNEEHFSFKIEHARDHIEYLVQYKKTTKVDCLELGTGWYPIVPIALFLCGVNRTNSIDIASHLSAESIKATLEKYIERDKKEGIEKKLPYIQKDKWHKLVSVYDNVNNYSLENLLDIFQIHPIVGDARKMSFDDNSIDFICSNNTFEHIYPDILKGILVEFRRINKKDGLMSHFIDLSDHFAHFDKSINIYNFLQFSSKAWNKIDNSIQPQNRWRWKDYKRLYKSLEIPISSEKVRNGDIKALQSQPLHSSFQKKYTLEELAISHGYLVSYWGK